MSIGVVLNSSCCKDEVIQLQDIGGAGDFRVINTTTNDTINVSGGIELGISHVLHAKNGDDVKILFIPNEKYSKYKFSVTYTLPGDKKVSPTNGYEYLYHVNGIIPGWYDMYLSASYEEDADKRQISITSVGKVNLNIAE